MKQNFEDDVWYIKNFNIESGRINPTNPINKFDFSDFYTHKEDAKLYIKYLIYNTYLAGETIAKRLYVLKDFFNYIGNKNINDLTRNDFLEYLNSLTGSNRNYDMKIKHLRMYNQFLIQKGILSEYLLLSSDTKSTHYEYRFSEVDDFVIEQIFLCFDEWEEYMKLLFLLIYCTGMRISEACSIKRKSLKEINKRYFLTFYQVKMRKYVDGEIPKFLYNLLISYEEKTNKYKNEYLILNTKHEQCKYSNTRQYFKRIMIKYGIKNKDGSSYEFKAHDYRHTLAGKMLENNTPIQFIQEQLHHNSIEMTKVYLEYTEEKKLNEIKKIVNSFGEESPITLTDTTIFTDEELQAELMRKELNTQILPMGICNQPVIYGTCNSSNSCLHCNHFRTTRDFLNVHKNQLKEIQEALKIAEINNFEIRIPQYKKDIEALEKIINSLEGKVND